MKGIIRKIKNNNVLTSFAFIICLVLASKLGGWYGAIAVLSLLLCRALYRLWQNRELILLLFNHSWSILRPNKFKPYYPDGEVTIMDLLGRQKK